MKITLFFRYLLFFISSLFFPFLSIAQIKKPERISLNKSSQHETGHPSNYISKIIQDNQGFIWAGTNGGLIRYDGENRKIFNTYEPNDIGITQIHTMLLDAKENIWLGHYSGDRLVKFNTITEKAIAYTKHSLQTEFNFTDIEALYEDSHGRIWIGTRLHGLFYLNSLKNKINIAGNEEMLKNTKINAFYEDDKKQLWVGTSSGLNVINLKNNTFISVSSDVDSFSFNISSLTIKNNKDLFITTVDDGIFLLNLNNNEITKLQFQNSNLENLNLSSLAIDNRERLWVASIGNGLYRLNEKKGEAIYYDLNLPSDNDSTPGNGINDIIIDNQQNLWAATYAGLQKLNIAKAPFEKYGNFMVTALGDWDENRLWVAGEQIYIFDKKNKKISPAIETFPELSKAEFGMVRGIFSDRNGGFWFVNQGRKNQAANTYYFHPKTKVLVEKFNQWSKDSIKRRVIISMTQNVQGDWWMASSQGILQSDSIGNVYKEWRHNPDDNNSLSGDFFLKIFEDHKGGIWGGGLRDGLNKLNPISNKIIRFFSQKDNTPLVNSKTIYNFCEDKEKNLWVGGNNGLYKVIDGGKEIISFSTNDGLSNNKTAAIEVDQYGNLWISTINGLNSYNDSTGKFRNFYVQDGLGNNTFVWGASATDKMGNLYFGEGKGVTVFHPDSISAQQDIPEIQLTDLKLFYHSLSTQDSIGVLKEAINYTTSVVFNHLQNVFTIQYQSLDFKDTESNNYAYILKPFQSEWQLVGNTTEATFTNLEAGDYTFKVKVRNSDGLWSLPAKLNIKILAPWYWTWWSKSFYGILFFGLIYTFYRFQLNRQFAENESLRLKELDEAKNQLYTNITHEFRTPLTVIQGMAAQINSPQYKKETRLINRNSQKLLYLINQVLDLAKLQSKKLSLQNHQSDIAAFLQNELESYIALASSRNIKMDFKCHPSEIEMDFDPYKLRQIIANLLSNAIKFMDKKGEIRVNVKKEIKESQALLLLEITDTGIGIPEHQLSKVFDRYFQVDETSTRRGEGSGIGLALTKELINFMGGQIMVSSQLHQGTTFNIILPITQKASKIDWKELILPNNLQEATISSPKSAIPIVENMDLPVALLVEDNEDVIEYLITCLQGEYRILTAFDGQEGLEIAKRNIPDIIISDVMMPKMDGFALTEALKKDVRTSHIPLVLLTAKADHPSKIQGLESGADAYLAKPFDRQELIIRLKNLLDLRQKIQHHYSSPAQLALSTEGKLSIDEMFLKDVQSKVMEHLDDSDYTVEQLAKDVNLSRAQLFRKLKGLTGESASGYMRLIRLTYAKTLLETGKFSVAEAAYKTGFSDPAYFSRCFSSLFHFPPSQTNT